MKKLFFLIAIIFCNAQSSFCAIRVSPAYLELDANTTSKDYLTSSFSVSGGKDESVRFKVYPEFFEFDTKGRYVPLGDKGQPNSLMGKVKFYPSEFTCTNGVSQKVRLTVTGLKSLPDGESRLVLFLEDVDTKEVALKKANGKYGGKIIVKTRVGVPIYVDRGNYVKKASFDSANFKKLDDIYACEFKVSSLGNSKVRYSGFGYISQGDKLIMKFEVPGSSVEGGKFVERIQQLDFPKNILQENQEYNVKFVLTYKDEKQREKVMKKELTFIPEKLEKSKI